MSILGPIAGIGGTLAGSIIGNIIYPGAGGIIGGMVGGMIGGVAGKALFPEKYDLNSPPPPKPRENRVQVSTYGAPVPIVYGSAKLAGNIIYMSEVTEKVTRSKHRQDGVRYYTYTKTYTCTFAVAFCSGPVIGYGRIWVNNEVFVDFRDSTGPYFPSGSTALAAGNLATSIASSAVYFSFYFGTEDQTADATLSAILGATETPAYKGIAYLVFKDFPVGEYRGVPTIEVELAESDEIDVTAPSLNPAYACSNYNQFSTFTEQDPDSRMTVGTNWLSILDPTEPLIRLYKTGLSLVDPRFRFRLTVTTLPSSGGANFNTTFGASGEASYAGVQYTVTTASVTVGATGGSTRTITDYLPWSRWIQVSFEENYVYVDFYLDDQYMNLQFSSSAGPNGWPDAPTVNAIYAIVKSINTAPDMQIGIYDFKLCTA